MRRARAGRFFRPAATAARDRTWAYRVTIILVNAYTIGVRAVQWHRPCLVGGRSPPSVSRAGQPRAPPPAVVSHQLVVDLARNAIILALLVAAPMLVVALGIGLIVSVIQAVTQIQEQTLSFVPKLVAVSATFLIALPWILQLLIKYTTELFRSLPALAS